MFVKRSRRGRRIGDRLARFHELTAPDVRVTVVEPGAVRTELVDHLTHAETKRGVAQIIAFTLSRRRHVAVNEILVRPAGQA